MLRRAEVGDACARRASEPRELGLMGDEAAVVDIRAVQHTLLESLSKDKKQSLNANAEKACSQGSVRKVSAEMAMPLSPALGISKWVVRSSSPPARGK